MDDTFHWTQAGQILARHPRKPARAAIGTALDAIGQAANDIVFAEMAAIIAARRVEVLVDMIAACEAERARGEVVAELDEAIDTLEAELERARTTLPLEQAFHADARDEALARIVAAQAGLRSALASSALPQPVPGLSRAEAVALARAMLSHPPDAIAAAARAEAEARLAGHALAPAGGDDYGFTQPEGQSAWLAGHCTGQAGGALGG